MKKEEQRYKRFTNWWMNRTPEEYQLHVMVLEFDEKHFTDLRLADKEAKRLLACKIQADDGKWKEVTDDPPDIDIDVGHWTFKFCRFRE
ncbi:hypothetical protein MYX75_02820 [Acidobacteria bacterium AH-259-A15]|nr:hypothetical protein [Acidobacteria bacterium AH-259-A15]